MMHHSRQVIKLCFWLIISISLPHGTRAQEMWGITTSNYAGSTGTLLNPTSIITSKLYMDINLATADIFFENNYAFIHKQDYSLFHFIRGKDFPEYGPDALPFDHYTGKNDKYVYASELLKGPSAMVAIGRHAFAIHTGARVLSSLYRIPYDIANFGYYGLDYTQQHNVFYQNKNFGSGELAIGEIGLTYAYSFLKSGMEDWSAGITLKRYFSVGGGYLQARDIKYIVLNDTTINIVNLDAEVGYSVPLDYDNNDFPDDGPRIKGGGFGVDIGFTYQNRELSYQKKRISKLCRQRYINYIYRIGVSLIDVGYVNFKTNAQVHDYNNVSEYWINIDTLNYYNINQLARTLSDVFYGDPDSSYQGDKVRVFLPTALSLQGDYKITKHWYAGAVIIQPLRLGKAYIRRPAQMVLIPRYESAKFEFSVPLSLYDYIYPRIGASVRYHFLTIGTDDLLGLAGMTNFTGLDFYVGIKINFSKGNCGRFNRNVPCENEEYGIRGR